MIFGPNIRALNELEINGEHIDDSDNEDFTAMREDDDDTEDTQEPDETTETDDASEDNTDDAQTEDDDEANDLEDFTDDSFDDVEDDEGDDNTDSDTEDEPEEDTEENQDDDLEDFTQDTLDDSEDQDGDEAVDTADESDEDDGGEDNDDTQTDDNEDGNDETDSDGSGDGDSLASMEKNLFSDLTPQQMAIKNSELLQNYIELYNTINIIFDDINKIPKTYNNTRILTFVADKLIELRDMVNYVITDTYVTKTYVENMAYYKQSLLILSQINTMLKVLIQKPSK